MEDWGEEGYVEKMLDPATMLERLKEQGSYSFIFSVYNAAGEIRTKKMHISAIDLRLGRVCFIRADVTDVLNAERKAKEELERALREAENASKVKSDFLSSMSHDIRTPMNAIVGMTTLALANLDNTDKLKDYLYKISVSSQHLLSLINDILDMSRIEAGKVELEQAPFSLRALGGRLYDMFAKTLDANGIHYAANFEEMTADWVIGDELRISQVIINFLSNAVKFTSQGEIIVTFRQMMLRDGKVDLMVRVHDTGIGMKAEFISRIFRLFEQEDTSTTRRFGGTGLGMAISDQLVKLMGGQIVVESLPESGSDFTGFLSLPGMGGRTAARTIRGLARPDAADIPIYALSADAFAEDERLSRENGMNRHLTKPIDFDALWQIAQDIENRKETAKR